MADVIIFGGDIITMEEKTPDTKKVEAIAITGDTIKAVGSIESVFGLKGPNTQVIFLNQQTLMPGFIEPHQHAIMCFQVRSMFTDISSAVFRTYGDVKNAMETKMKTIADDSTKWGLFWGWDPELIPDLPTLNAAFLDTTFSSVNPMVVFGQSGHVAWVNSPALKVSGINKDTQQPVGGTIVKDEDGNPTGQLFEDPAITMVLEHAPMPSETDLIAAISAQYKYYASVGLTTVTELGYMPNQSLDEVLKKVADDACPIRLGLYRMTHASKDGIEGQARNIKPTLGCCPSHGIFDSKIKTQTAETEEGGVGNYNDKLWEAGLKLVADGSPHCGTAAVREPFLNMPVTETLGFPPAPTYGILNYDFEALFDTVKRNHLKGKQIAIHCHGERACEQVLKVHEQVVAQCDPMDNRHRMEHLGLMTVEQVARAGKVNLALSFFVDHLRYYSCIYKTDLFGDRVNRWTPLSEATKNGITWTIHQDHPTFPGSAQPFANIKTAVTRCHRDDPNVSYGPEYRVSIHEALKSYTVNAAWQLHHDHDLGSIKVGKKADLVVLSDNPYMMDPFELENIKVIETFVNGQRNKISTLKENFPGSDVKVMVL